MNIAILGFDRQGKDAYEYWKKPENSITICDKNSNLTTPDGVKTILGESYLQNLHTYDLLIRTPGLHPQQIADANPDNPEVLTKVWSVTNEFFKTCPSKNIIGVTGTKGKGTTSTLITKILESAGKKVHLGGNIGISPLQMLKDIQPDDWVVLELANFQLIDLQFSPPIAVCLMVEPEHQDWHTNMQEYVAAKQQLFVHQNPENKAVFYAKNDRSKQVASVSEAKKIPYMQQPGAVVANDKIVIDGQIICKTEELKLLGKHNWQNVCAAVTAVWQITQNKQAIKSVLTSFSGMPFRLERIRTIDGVQYYNDSFGTTPETAKVAIDAFSQPKIIILGGSDKGSDYTQLAQIIKESKIRKVLLIGEMATKIKSTLDSVQFSNYVAGGNSMIKIVQTAQQYAKPNDVVLLSTACASFDMFKNYQDRGEQFNEAVKSLSSTEQ